jgi:hypothetical protein
MYWTCNIFFKKQTCLETVLKCVVSIACGHHAEYENVNMSKHVIAKFVLAYECKRNIYMSECQENINSQIEMATIVERRGWLG